jgi:hypothetical protein
MPPTAENDKQNNSSASELDFMDEEENDGKNYVQKERVPPKNSQKHRMAELKNVHGVRIDANLSGVHYRSISMRYDDDRLNPNAQELTPGKFMLLKDCEFISQEILENIDDKDVQGRLFKVFKGEIEHFKNKNDSIIDEDDQLDPDQLIKIIDIQTERNPEEENDCDIENDWDANMN